MSLTKQQLVVTLRYTDTVATETQYWHIINIPTLKYVMF